mmetsp:Transcript_83033/g.184492  ORF Transcript_83033/g.184492 Transcript_83033/m.184492 type:complete len:210 (-) Transcript_83033:495-1124(-)
MRSCLSLCLWSSSSNFARVKVSLSRRFASLCAAFSRTLSLLAAMAREALYLASCWWNSASSLVRSRSFAAIARLAASPLPALRGSSDSGSFRRRNCCAKTRFRSRWACIWAVSSSTCSMNTSWSLFFLLRSSAISDSSRFSSANERRCSYIRASRAAICASSSSPVGPLRGSPGCCFRLPEPCTSASFLSWSSSMFFAASWSWACSFER